MGVIWVVVAGVLGSPCAQGAEVLQKKLLEFGWDEPDTTFLCQHIGEMQQTPFDGCVFHADYRKADGAKGSFTWQGWGTQAFTETDLQQAFADLRTARLGPFKDNFLRFNTTPAKLDWFDDYRAVTNNARLAARLARAGHCPGVLFDIEQYEGQLFNYRRQRDAPAKSWEVYAAQAHRRGRAVMDAFQEGYPGLTVFLTFGYSLPWAQTQGGKKPLADCSYGLLAPFLDGMVEGAKRARLVDGYELSYGYKTAAQFQAARKAFNQDVLAIVQDRAKYERVFSQSFGLWLDHDWRKQGWDEKNPSRNYFSPSAFRSAVGEALKVADQYVWVYSETPRWWSAEGKPVKLPAEYQKALKELRASAEAPER